MLHIWLLNADCLAAICRRLTVDDLLALAWQVQISRCAKRKKIFLAQHENGRSCRSMRRLLLPRPCGRQSCDSDDSPIPVLWEWVRVESYAQRHTAWLLTRLVQLDVARWTTRLEFLPALARPVDGLFAEDGRPFKRALAEFLRANHGALRHFHSKQNPLVDVYWDAVVWRLARSECARRLKTLAYQPYGESVLAAKLAAGKARLSMLTTAFPSIENLLMGESVLGGWDAIEFVVTAWSEGLYRLLLTDEYTHFGPRIVGGLLAQTRHLKHLTLVNSLTALPSTDSGDQLGDFPLNISLPSVHELVIVHEHDPGLKPPDIQRLLKTFPELRALHLYTDVFAYFPDHDWTESNIMHEYNVIRQDIKLICRQSNVELYWRNLRP